MRQTVTSNITYSQDHEIELNRHKTTSNYQEKDNTQAMTSSQYHEKECNDAPYIFILS